MDKIALKKKLLDAVEVRSEDIISVGEWIWRHPEVGFWGMDLETPGGRLQRI
jgi:hypothetical protein